MLGLLEEFRKPEICRSLAFRALQLLQDSRKPKSYALMEAGIVDHIWNLAELLGAWAKNGLQPIRLTIS